MSPEVLHPGHLHPRIQALALGVPMLLGCEKEAEEQLGSQKAVQGELGRKLRKMFHEPLEENETGTQKVEDHGRVRAWKSSLRMRPKDQRTPLHTHLIGVLRPLPETRTEPSQLGGRQMQGNRVSEGQEAASLWRAGGSLLGKKGYSGRKVCVDNRRAFGQAGHI